MPLTKREKEDRDWVQLKYIKAVLLGAYGLFKQLDSSTLVRSRPAALLYPSIDKLFKDLIAELEKYAGR
jgi:hypothetical protein